MSIHFCSICGNLAIVPTEPEEVMYCAEHPDALIHSISDKTAKTLSAKFAGSIKTEKKAQSSAQNGKKGGRPPHPTAEDCKAGVQYWNGKSRTITPVDRGLNQAGNLLNAVDRVIEIDRVEYAVGYWE